MTEFNQDDLKLMEETVKNMKEVFPEERVETLNKDIAESYVLARNYNDKRRALKLITNIFNTAHIYGAEVNRFYSIIQECFNTIAGTEMEEYGKINIKLMASKGILSENLAEAILYSDNQQSLHI